jgi:hypothetical protein
MSLTSLVTEQEGPAGSAKLTLEGLQHWVRELSVSPAHFPKAFHARLFPNQSSHTLPPQRVRLAAEVEQLATDIDAAEAMAERWCGKCTEGLHELKHLRDQKTKYMEEVTSSIAKIQQEAEAAALVARKPGSAPMLLVPRSAGHPSMIPMNVTPRLFSKNAPVNHTVRATH